MNAAGEAKPIQVLLIGNNPTELGRMLAKVSVQQGRRIITEIAFDIRSMVDRLMRFRPHFVLIDDNIGAAELRQAVDALAHHRRTKDTPITVLKNSNYREALPLSGLVDYLMKQQLTADALLSSVRNSLKLRRTRVFLQKAYRTRKVQIIKMLKAR